MAQLVLWLLDRSAKITKGKLQGVLSVILPLVDPFKATYESWETRPATFEEMTANGCFDEIKIAKIASISDAFAAAEHIAKVSEDNGLSDHIQTALRKDPAYKTWRNAMPSRTPIEISRYQKDYPKCSFTKVSEEIDRHGRLLSPGQSLFHGGVWPGNSAMITTRPFSTSLCPQVALRNAEYNAKAYNAGRIDLFVLRAINPMTKAFVFKRFGTRLGHESEVLLSSGARVEIKKQHLIRSEYPASKYGYPDIRIPVYVLELEVS